MYLNIHNHAILQTCIDSEMTQVECLTTNTRCSLDPMV